MFGIVLFNNQAPVQPLFELISRSVSLEFSVLVVARVAKKVFFFPVSVFKILLSGGFNQLEVNGYAIKNEEELLRYHNLQKYINSKIAAKFTRELALFFLFYRYTGI